MMSSFTIARSTSMKSQSDSMSGRARPSSGDMRPAERRQDAGSPPMREAEEKREFVGKEERRPKGGRSSFIASVLNDPATRFERQASGSPRQAKVDETKARKTEMKREAKMEYLELARLKREEERNQAELLEADRRRAVINGMLGKLHGTADEATTCRAEMKEGKEEDEKEKENEEEEEEVPLPEGSSGIIGINHSRDELFYNGSDYRRFRAEAFRETTAQSETPVHIVGGVADAIVGFLSGLAKELVPQSTAKGDAASRWNDKGEGTLGAVLCI